MKTFVRFLLLASVWVTAVSIHAGLLYETNSDGFSVTISGYASTVPNVLVIPSNINGLTVTAIGDTAFSDEKDLISVTIPSTITKIGEYSFSSTGLTNVMIPFGVTNIGVGAFGSCESLTNAVIPESVTTLGDGAFSMTELTSVSVFASATNVGPGVFEGCGELTNVTIEIGVSNIPSFTFSGCEALVSVTIPKSVTNIGSGTFSGCENLTNVLFLGNAPAVDSTVFQNTVLYGHLYEEVSNYYTATAYYLPGTTGWAQFSSNTLMAATYGGPTNVFVPAVLWNPTILSGFGVDGNQFGFYFEGNRNLPIAIEACDDLSQTNWVRLVTRTTPFGPGHFSEPFQSNTPARFYRIGFP